MILIEYISLQGCIAQQVSSIYADGVGNKMLFTQQSNLRENTNFTL